MLPHRQLLMCKIQRKGKCKASATESDSTSASTKRNNRSKQWQQPNVVASRRGTMAAKAVGKRTSEQSVSITTVVLMDDENDKDHDKVIFIDDNTEEPILALYRKNENAEPMSHLWDNFIRDTQLVRDQIGSDILGSFLKDEEIRATKLKQNAHLFPTLVTCKGAIRSKNNAQAASKASRSRGVFTAKSATVQQTKAEEFLARAKMLKQKASAFSKQATVYEAAAELQGDANANVDKVNLESGMTFLGRKFPLSRKELTQHMEAHEGHIVAVAERLRGEMSSLATYVNRAEKRLRDDIQLKVAADLKLLRDIKRFGHFELQAWQVHAFP